MRMRLSLSADTPPPVDTLKDISSPNPRFHDSARAWQPAKPLCSADIKNIGGIMPRAAHRQKKPGGPV
jgi:hypothetical protein